MPNAFRGQSALAKVAVKSIREPLKMASDCLLVHCNKLWVRCGSRHFSSKGVDYRRFRAHPLCMRSLPEVLVAFLFTSCVPVIAQTDPHRQLLEAYAFQYTAQTGMAIERAQALLDAGLLDHTDSGRAWILLGICDEDEGRFADAQHAYEHAIQILG